MIRKGQLSAIFLSLAPLYTTPVPAHESGEQCARAAEQAQVLRGEGKLNQSQKELRICLDTSCPELIRRDCASWLADVEASVPTVIIAARTEQGADVVDARVFTDRLASPDKVDGLARPLDPGLHHFRVESPGFSSTATDVLLVEGQKRRLIALTMPAVSFKASPSGVLNTSSHHDGLEWAALGIGLSSFAGFAILGLTGLHDLRALQQGCGTSRTCSRESVDSVRTRLWFADGLLGLGLISTAIGGALWLRLHHLLASGPGRIENGGSTALPMASWEGTF